MQDIIPYISSVHIGAQVIVEFIYAKGENSVPRITILLGSGARVIITHPFANRSIATRASADN